MKTTENLLCDRGEAQSPFIEPSIPIISTSTMRLHRIVVPARAPAGKGLTSMASSPLSPPRGHCRRNRTSSRAPSACSSDVGSATDTGASGSCACSRLGSREAASADSGTASDRGVLLFYYLLFGGLHELCHLAVAASAARFLHHPCFAGTESGVLLETVRHAGGTAQFLLRTFLLRRTEIPYLRCTSEVDGICVADVGGEGGAIDPAASLQTASDIIRHSGWIFSVLLAILVLLHHRQDMQPSSSSTRSVRLLVFLSSRRPSAMAVAAALITALEALSTDLLGIDALPIFDQSALSSTSSSSSRPMPTWTFLCGNFGLIILNSAWTTADGGRHTLDLLEKMVSVTMMRGAQSGGVLTFAPSRTRPSGSDPLVAFRSRVVNRKRSDLSHLLRTRVARDVFSTMSSAILSRPTACKTMKSGGGVNSAGGLGRNDTISVQTYSGHTRFATSSKATLDGTHPQRWSDPSYRTYYNFRSVANDLSAKQQASKNGNRGSFPFRTRVENYVTHNGDFDFYSLNGKVYDLDIVRPWLEMATCRPCPSTVDSACIAGFVDLIRSKGW